MCFLADRRNTYMSEQQLYVQRYAKNELDCVSFACTRGRGMSSPLLVVFGYGDVKVLITEVGRSGWSSHDLLGRVSYSLLARTSGPFDSGLGPEAWRCCDARAGWTSP